jgi:valyl-tRNA synthetase
MDKVYDPHNVERRWYSFWTENGYFTADSGSDKPPFCIVIPPPNVTGVLHMGHALNNTLQDISTRFKRMAGFNALWVPGTDHAGIATQNVVERELQKENLTTDMLGREAFTERVWKWKERSGGLIIEQLKRLGCSCDWSRERFTMDAGLSKAVREVFVRLYEEGLIYRGDYIINWCPRCGTALSDLEVEHEDVKGHLYHIRYPLADEPGYLIVATTRPETLLGDTAVAVNPTDERYGRFVGKHVILPIVGKKIPIIGDSYVDTSFGTGVLKVTPAHDLNDFEIGKRHKLDVVKVIDDEGRMNDKALHYKGMDRFECREKIVEELQAKGLFEKIEDYPMGVGRCYRCKTVVEPSLSLQWFVSMKQLAEPAIEAVREHRVRIIPDMWEKVYFEWMENIKDWCISRQIWWGHRIPVWYCDHCDKMYVSREEPKACQECGGSLRQETDVLDTWFSSGLWPFSTLGWPSDTDDLKAFYPTSVLITGFDILFFWVARMIMMGLHFMNDVPFGDVYIHALVRDAEGKKMSKSKGNVIDPLLVMDQYGTDAFRFTLAMLAAQGRDVLLSEERVEGGRNFVNKIWNASRLTFALLENVGAVEGAGESSFLPDKWIRSRCRKVAKEVADAIDTYRYSDAAHQLYNFIWHEFCDWYLELIKPVLYGKVPGVDRGATGKVLQETFTNIVGLLHPFMPFVTEELYQRLPTKVSASVMIAPFPKGDGGATDDRSEAEMDVIVGVIDAIRNIRGEMAIAPNLKVDVLIRANKEKGLIEEYAYFIKELAKIENMDFTETKLERAAMGIYKEVEIFVPIKDTEVINRELARIEKELSKIEGEIARIGKKLQNRDFREKAPVEVIQKEEAAHGELLSKQEKLIGNRTRLEGILGR